MNILIIYANSGRGLKKDARILELALAGMGHTCRLECLPTTPEWKNTLSHYRHRLLSNYLPSVFSRFYYACRAIISNATSPPSESDLVIHLENIRPSHLGRGTYHWLIPNQEWFIESRLPFLGRIDQILCKTRHALQIFSQYHPNVTYLGFTAEAKVTASAFVKKNDQLALHVAGNSQLKGTAAVMNCWSRHPEWPKLVVVSQHLNATDYPNRNIDIRRNLTNEEMRTLWQEARFAVLPSEVEGYGQILAEALANGCVTISTNAPPMNELIEESRGYLVAPSYTRSFRLGTRYVTSPDALETTVARVLDEPPEILDRISMNASQWYATNQKSFIQRLQAAISELGKQLPDKPGHRDLKSSGQCRL
ncbi:MAG: glycosyltransferase family 4 protein [Gammaproteobacteria bacterium]|nr:glycosyltransferase family 4 protein [Gammaproteobacteria bacterium]